MTRRKSAVLFSASLPCGFMAKSLGNIVLKAFFLFKKFFENNPVFAGQNGAVAHCIIERKI